MQLMVRWKWVLEDNYDLKNEIARSTYAGMLHDTERNEKYFEALQLTVEDLKSEGKTYIQALDIGAGTGILSMMAAKAGANHVTACESFEPMSKTAEKVVARNGLENMIRVVNKNSKNLLVPDDMPQKADILVTEIFDTELIGEGVLPSLRDAHERLLSAKCKVIPSHAHVNIQLIESEKLVNMNKLRNVEVKIPRKFEECSGTAAAHEIQINQLHPNDMKLLSDKYRMNSFDFQSPFYLQSTSAAAKYSSVEITAKATSAGCIHAVLFWWDLVLHDGGNIVLSMEPTWMRNEGEEYVWRDHWMQAVYYLKKPLNVRSGNVVFIKMFHDDYSIWFDVTEYQKTDFVDRPLCSCGLHISWARERFAMFNNSFLRKYFKTLVKQINENSNSVVVVVVGETSLLPLYLSCQFKNHLTYVEYSQFSQQIVKKLAVVNNVSHKLTVISKDECENADVIISEPYFSSSLLPWHHFQIWYLINDLDPIKIYPSKASLKACLIELDDLWKVRAPVVQVEGFDLSDFDSLIQDALSPIEIPGHGFFESVEPFSLWEFKQRLLSDATTIAEFNFMERIPKKIIRYDGQLDRTAAGHLHAVALWTEFHLDDGIYWSTGLTVNKDWVNYSKQGVFFLKDSQRDNKSVDYHVLFVPDQCEMMFSFC